MCPRGVRAYSVDKHDKEQRHVSATCALTYNRSSVGLWWVGERTSPITPLYILCTISDSSLDLRVDIVVPSRGLGLPLASRTVEPKSFGSPRWS